MGADWPARYTRWDARRYGRNVCRETAVAATVSNTHTTSAVQPVSKSLRARLVAGDCAVRASRLPAAGLTFGIVSGRATYWCLSSSQFPLYIHAQCRDLLEAHQVVVQPVDITDEALKDVSHLETLRINSNSKWLHFGPQR